MDFIERLKSEKEELKIKCENLHKFIRSEKFKGVSTIQRSKMIEQLSHMMNYGRCLDARLIDLEVE